MDRQDESEAGVARTPLFQLDSWKVESAFGVMTATSIQRRFLNDRLE
jgi:hypothetical protein